MGRNEKYRRKLRRRIVLFLACEQNLRFGDGLGARCEYCWTEEKKLNKRRLEFDHTCGRTWRLDKTSHYRRLRILSQEALDGLIKLCCRRHNMKRYHERSEELPF